MANRVPADPGTPPTCPRASHRSHPSHSVPRASLHPALQFSATMHFFTWVPAPLPADADPRHFAEGRAMQHLDALVNRIGHRHVSTLLPRLAAALAAQGAGLPCCCLTMRPPGPHRCGPACDVSVGHMHASGCAVRGGPALPGVTRPRAAAAPWLRWRAILPSPNPSLSTCLLRWGPQGRSCRRSSCWRRWSGWRRRWRRSGLTSWRRPPGSR